MPKSVPIVLACVLWGAAAVMAAEPVPGPKEFLAQSLKDPQTVPAVLAALRSTGDKELLPLLVALSQSQDKNVRLYVTRSLAELGGKDAAEALLGRLNDDAETDIRIEALVGLLALKAISDEQLVATLKADSKDLQCLAACALSQRAGGKAAEPTLQRLAGERDLFLQSLARMSLLGMGHQEQLAALSKIIKAPNTPGDIPHRLMEQIVQEKVSAALELAEQAAQSDKGPLQGRAYRAIAAVSPKATTELVEAIHKSGELTFRVSLLQLLAARDDARAALEGLTGETDGVGALARLELARAAGGQAAQDAAMAAVKLEHPVIIDYVLDAARKDITDKADKADFYAPALLAFIRSVEPQTSVMKREHVRAAQAATMLADLGTSAAMEALKELLAGRYNAIQRAAAAGLLRTKNKAACELARPMLSSPYEELASDAALMLGRFGDPGAKDHLTQILAHGPSHSRELVSLAAWYLLKIDGQTASAVAELAKTVK